MTYRTPFQDDDDEEMDDEEYARMEAELEAMRSQRMLTPRGHAGTSTLDRTNELRLYTMWSNGMW